MLLVYILSSVLIISVMSFAGILSLVWKKHDLREYLPYLVALAAGSMMGTAFLHLLPEAAEFVEPQSLFLSVLLAFIFFFFVEKVLHWRHCHSDNCEMHTFGLMNLIGDGFHNFLDGLIIAAAYATGIEVGIATTIAVVIHEIPQEIGDFGVLLKAGFSVKRALLMNFFIALISVMGGLIGFFLISQTEGFIKLLTPLAAGGFLYIAATDLIPQLQEEKNINKSVRTVLMFLLGVFLTYLLQFIVHE